MLAGTAASFDAPRPRSGAGGVAVAPDATCLAVQRHADYVAVQISIGLPMRYSSVLLRLDRVLAANDTEPALRFFEQEAVESGTVSCDGSGKCEDVVLLKTGVDGDLKPHVARFAYRQKALERSAYTTAYALGLGGELALRMGTRYWLTSTHLCYSAAPPTSFSYAMVEARVQADGSITATRTALLASDEVRNAPVVLSEYTDRCQNANFSQTVRIFPSGAGTESGWLSVMDDRMFNTDPATVDLRRTIVEIGSACAALSSDLTRALSLYQLDCSPYGTCSSEETLPFRRVATSSLIVNIDSSGTVGMWTEEDPTLTGLPGLANSFGSFVLSLVKLLMIVLCAAVVFARSRKPTASSSWLFKRALRTASTTYDPADDEIVASFEDMIIGALAFSARALVAMYRLRALTFDGQGRVVLIELCAASLSFTHWVLRFFCVTDLDPPIVLLGGSTAILDATAAVMLAFSEPPTFIVSDGRFDATARLLTGLLIALLVSFRTAFSASACGVLWEAETNSSYRGVLMFGLLTWVLQAAALATLLGDLFVAPMVFSMMRFTPGSQLSARILLFVALTCAGLPRLNTTLRHILSSRDKVD
jgi:hypothetical protein